MRSPRGGLALPTPGMDRYMSKHLKTGLYWFLALQFALGAVTKYWPGDTIFSTAYSEHVGWYLQRDGSSGDRTR